MADFDYAVIGAGVTGLSTAYFLHQQDPKAKIVIFEQQGRSGGKIDSAKVGPLEIELGPDATIARDPIITDMFQELGLIDELVTQRTESARIYYDNELRPLPHTTAFGLPVSAKELKHSGLITGDGEKKFKQLSRRTMKPTKMDMSLGTFVRTHMGDEVAEHVVGPLLGGIHAGPIDTLSLQATSPQLAEFAVSGGSVHDVLEPRAALPKQPMFVSLRHGMPQLVSRLHECNAQNGVKSYLESPVARLELADNEVQIVNANRDRFTTRAVVVATPSFVAADMLRGVDAKASELLDTINHASVAMCIFAYEKQFVENMPDASGFLLGHDSLLLMTACSFGTNKWERYDDGEHIYFRVSTGRADDVRAFAMEDKELVRHLHTELSNILSIKSAPKAATLRRWPRSFPQYAVGHLQKLEMIENSLEELAPNIRIAGASYRGVGIPACIRQARRATDDLKVFATS